MNFTLEMKEDKTKYLLQRGGIENTVLDSLKAKSTFQEGLTPLFSLSVPYVCSLLSSLNRRSSL